MLNARFIYSACIVLETNDISICCDPWFSEGAYDGSWFQFPRVEDPIDAIGQVDAIYISHIHPDHYDPKFLREYLQRNRDCRLIIGMNNQEFLAQKMLRDGFEPLQTNSLTVGETEITIVENSHYEYANIDSAMVVKRGRSSVVNLNDCVVDTDQILQIKNACGGNPTVAFLPFAGAGPFPQKYLFDDENDRKQAEDHKRRQFLDQYQEYIQRLCPKIGVPFAGQYYLGGQMRSLNWCRGVPDAVEVLEVDGSTSTVLLEESGTLNAETLSIEGQRTKPHSRSDIDTSLERTKNLAYNYENESLLGVDRQSSLLELFRISHGRALRHVKFSSPHWLCIVPNPDQFFCLDLSGTYEVSLQTDISKLMPREEIYLDERHLFGLLTRRYHWNNAEIGSHFSIRRAPNHFNRDVYNFLNFLHI